MDVFGKIVSDHMSHMRSTQKRGTTPYCSECSAGITEFQTFASVFRSSGEGDLSSLSEMVCCKRTQGTWKLGFRGACIGVVLSAWSAIIAGGGAEAWSFISKRGFALHPIKGASMNRSGKLHAYRYNSICMFCLYIIYKPTYYLPSTLPYPFLPYYHTMTIP